MTCFPESPSYSVVVPVFESGPALRDLVMRLVEVFEGIGESSFEIILVDDGSKNPLTRDLSMELATLPNVALVRLIRNFGKPGAIICGLAMSRGEWVATIDDDLQQRPEDLPLLIARRDHDVVTATHDRLAFSAQKRLTGWLKSKVDQVVLGHSVRLSPMKLIRRPVADAMVAAASERPFIPALIRYATTDVVAVRTPHEPSAYPASRYTLRTRWRQFSNVFAGDTRIRTRTITWIGTAVACAGFVGAAQERLSTICGRRDRNPSNGVASALLVVGGLFLAAVGLRRQCDVGNLHSPSEVPAYVVGDVVGFSDTRYR